MTDTLRHRVVKSVSGKLRSKDDPISELLPKIPQMVLEALITERVLKAGFIAKKAAIQKAAYVILRDGPQTVSFGSIKNHVEIEISYEDLAAVNSRTETFKETKLAHVIEDATDKIVHDLYGSLSQTWTSEFAQRESELHEFKERLNVRWGKALNKLRMLHAIIMEWAQEEYLRKRGASGLKLSHMDDVTLRLLVRACQVTREVIILLENGHADGAMARWRTLHEIGVVFAVIVKFGEGIAEMYVYFQIVESYAALKTYQNNYQELRFKPPSKEIIEKTTKSYEKTLRRFGKRFGDDYGWATKHLQLTDKERVTFARLEREADNAMMRSPYKFASYNVHASPKGIYFTLGSLQQGSPVLLAGASNAGLVDPAQHTAVTLAEMALLAIGQSSVFEQILTAKIISRLEFDIPRELAKADRKLRRDDLQQRKLNSSAERPCKS